MKENHGPYKVRNIQQQTEPACHHDESPRPPARIAIIQQLIKANACICGDLVEELGLAQATISQHLKELKNAGLIKGTIEGKSICYCIDQKVWKQYQKEMDQFFTALNPAENCC